LLLFAVNSFALTPDQILIVISSAGPEGTRIAKGYCAKRGVPESQIAAFPMRSSETISRADYDNFIARPLRRFLEERPELRSRIRCLLTVYGVPLRIGTYKPTSEERKTIVSLTHRLEEEREALREQMDSLARLAEEVGTNTLAAAETHDTSVSVIKVLPKEMKTARSTLESVSKQIETLDPDQRQDEVREALRQIRTNLLGAASARDRSTEDAATEIVEDYAPEGNNVNAVLKSDAVKDYSDTQIGTQEREKLYGVREDTSGLIGLCEQILADIAEVEKHDSEASVDSELSLLYWRKYNLRGWLPNLLNPRFRSRLKPPLPPPPLMVARLDGPTPELAMELVDRALRGEEKGLRGKFYIDASLPKRKQGKMYKVYDESLEKLADGARAHTNLEVVLDKGGGLFPPGSCSDAALYCGWYSPRKYVDAFTWVPGAVGFHISSFAAQGLRSKDSEGWCKRMLEDGVAATLGPVSEPYLHTFPLPEDFFKVFLSGKASLVESYYLTKPFNSWRMVLVGDPLYNPFKYHPAIPEEEVQNKNSKTPGSHAEN